MLTQPLLVVVEDLHWADQSSYDLLTFLLTRGFSAPVGLVGSYRSDDLHRRHPLRPLLAAWNRLPGVRRLEQPATLRGDQAEVLVVTDGAVRDAELLRHLGDGPRLSTCHAADHTLRLRQRQARVTSA